MRVSSTQYHITVNSSLQENNSQLEKLMAQMASGNRLTKPSDDPITHVRISRLQREEASNTQYQSNILALSTRMSQSETVLTSMNGDLQEMRDLLVWALDGSNTEEDLAAMSANLKAFRDSIYTSTLTKDQEGNYLFSGTATRSATVALDETQPAGQRYSMGGNASKQMVQVGNGLVQPANVVLTDGATNSTNSMAYWLNQLDVAIDALEQGKTSNDAVVRTALTAGLQTIDSAMDGISERVAQLGGGQNILATLGTNLGNLSTANKIAILDYAQLDYAEAAVQLNTLQAAIKATQSAYGRVSQLSLFDAL